mgnify:CR=1 FL=1
MSSQSKIEEKSKNFYESEKTVETKKVNLNDLVNRMNIEKKVERKNNIIISAAAISAVTIFGVILTL